MVTAKISLTVCSSIHISCKHNLFKTDILILKLYTVVVYDLRMCMKKDN